jgi:glycerophosphoryl diester phosphodiesterase
MNSSYRSPRANLKSRSAAGVVLAAAAVGGSLATSAPASAAESYTVIAHRGDRDARPENTLAAFKSAIAKGADAIEMDVAFSRTGYPVVIHDLTLDRTTNCTGKVSSKTVSQLHKCDAGSWFSSAYKGEQIPTLWDAMKYIHSRSSSTKVILHMKVTPTRDQAKIVMQRVNLNGMADRAIVMASNPTAMSRMKEAGAKRQAFIFSSASGWDYKYKIMVPYETAITASKVKAAHARGAKVWTVESHPLSLKSLVNLTVPVDGVMVNHLTSSVLDLLSGVVKQVVTQSVSPTVKSVTKPVETATVQTESVTGPTPEQIEAEQQKALEAELKAAEEKAAAAISDAEDRAEVDPSTALVPEAEMS